MMKAINNQSWTGIPHGLTSAIIDSVFHHLDCTACALGKRNKLPREKGTGIHPVDVGHTLSFDYQPVTSPSITGHTGYFLFKCLFSGFRHAVLVKSKDRKTLIESTKQVSAFYNKHGFQVRKLRFDQGSSELSADFLEYLDSQGIDYSPAAVKAQFQNPVEREVQTVNKGVATLFADQHLLSSYFWPYALNHWILAANATPINGTTSPVELVTGRSIDISRMFRFPFGCPLTSTKEQPKVAFPAVKSEIGISKAHMPRTTKLSVFMSQAKVSVSFHVLTFNYLRQIFHHINVTRIFNQCTTIFLTWTIKAQLLEKQFFLALMASNISPKSWMICRTKWRFHPRSLPKPPPFPNIGNSNRQKQRKFPPIGPMISKISHLRPLKTPQSTG
jgi:hypothetical protein